MRYRPWRQDSPVWLMITLILGFITLAIAVVWGWVANIIDLIGMTNIWSTGEGIVRVIGIPCFPIGVFMGWFF